MVKVTFRPVRTRRNRDNATATWKGGSSPNGRQARPQLYFTAGECQFFGPVRNVNPSGYVGDVVVVHVPQGLQIPRYARTHGRI